MLQSVVIYGCHHSLICLQAKEFMEQQSFLEKGMNNYYFAQQPTIATQSSQILTPMVLQQSNYTILRGTLTERAHQDLKLGLPLAPSAPTHPPALSRDGSFKHLHEAARSGQPTVIQTRSVGGIENQRTFSDYQITPGLRTEEQQLPMGGGYNISSKIGQKIKNKTDLHKSNSKATLNSAELNKTPSIRYVESVIENDKPDFAKIEAVIQIINSEITKISERVNKHQERIQRLQTHSKKSDQGNQNVFSSPQMQEINKILSLVEKTQQRDDYRKAMKMIEQLRETILDLNSEVKTISEAQSPHLLKSNDEAIQLLRKQVLDSVNQKNSELSQASQLQVKELMKRVGEIQQSWKHWRKDQESASSFTSSVKKFEGKMITLIYQEKLTHSQLNSGVSHTLTTGIAKNTVNLSQKENNNTVVMTTKTYYLDSNGYLLDKNKYYLLNQRNEQIRLSEKQIELLKKHNIL